MAPSPTTARLAHARMNEYRRSSPPGPYLSSDFQSSFNLLSSCVPARLGAVYRLDQLSGVLVALASPIKRDGSVDEAGVERLVKHVLDGGVNGVLALGSTGETAS